jgi:hypothetical protein
MTARTAAGTHGCSYHVLPERLTHHDDQLKLQAAGEQRNRVSASIATGLGPSSFLVARRC